MREFAISREKLVDRLQAGMRLLDFRQTALLAAATSICLAAALVFLLVKPALRDYTDSSARETRLSRTLTLQEPMGDSIRSLSSEVVELRDHVLGGAAGLPGKLVEAYIVAELQSVSWRNGVHLVAIEPAEKRVDSEYEEIEFKVSLEGRYFDLRNWLDQVTLGLGFVVVKNLDVRTDEVDYAADPRLAANLRLAAYRIRRES